MSLRIGDPLPSFRLPAVGGGHVSPADAEGAPATIVAFWCNHCPYVRAWEERFIQIARDYADRGVTTLAVCANDWTTHPGDSFENMALRAAEMAYPFAYAHDASQEVAHAFGAERTPEVFVADAQGRLAYHGAIDDSAEPDAVAGHHLRAALDALVAGEAPATAETPAVGCTIKWSR